MAEQLYATLKTNQGDIEIRLLPNHAPKTVKNFVELATGEREWTHPATGAKSKDRLYDGTVFHRVISGFMIQGGDPWATEPVVPGTSSVTSSTPTSPSPSRTCWRWPTRARAPMARSSS